MDSVRNRKNKNPMDTSHHSEERAHLINNSSKEIFMLYNPLSGSREAEAYTNLGSTFYEFKMSDNTQVNLRIFNLLIKEELEQMKEDVQNTTIQKLTVNPNDDKSVIILLCGGDGTFMNIVDDFKQVGIDINLLLFVVFPFGTANDISRNFGWGTTPSNKMLENLYLVCDEIIHAKETGFDVWEISVAINQDTGDIQKPDGANLKTIEEVEQGSRLMTKYMCHSFSFGSDARTGIAFERRRTRNRHCNRVRYAFEGFKNFIR